MPQCPRLCSGLGMAGVALGFGLLAACASDTTGPVVTNSVAYWQLQVNHHAVTLALTPPYDTIQLVATPLNAAGLPVADTGTTTWIVSSTKVHVDVNGVLHADSVVSNPLKIYASRTIGGVTWQDSVLVQVNAIAGTVGTLTISGNTDFCPVNEQLLCYPVTFTGTVTDASGNVLSNVALAFSTSDALLKRTVYDGTNIVSIYGVSRNRLQIVPVTMGHVTLYTEATVYGRSLRDSVPFTVGPPDFACVYVEPSQTAGRTTPVGLFNLGTVTVGEGSTVMWLNISGQPIDVIFDDPSAVQSTDSAAVAAFPYSADGFRACGYYEWYVGNFPRDGGGSIATWPSATITNDAIPDDGTGLRARTFPTAGTYHYHSSEGARGTMIVVPNGGTWDPAEFE